MSKPRNIPQSLLGHLSIFERIAEAILAGEKKEIRFTLSTEKEAYALRYLFYRWKRMLKSRIDESPQFQTFLDAGYLTEVLVRGCEVVFRDRNQSPLALQLAQQLQEQGLSLSEDLEAPTSTSHEDLVQELVRRKKP